MSIRLEKIASTIRLVIADAILHKLSDPRISSFSSVTRVEVTGDLMHARVFVSVMGDETAQRKTMQGLLHATGHVQTLLAKRLKIRQCPHIVFLLDESMKIASQTVRTVDEAMAELDGRGTEDDELRDASVTDLGPGDDT